MPSTDSIEAVILIILLRTAAIVIAVAAVGAALAIRFPAARSAMASLRDGGRSLGRELREAMRRIPTADRVVLALLTIVAAVLRAHGLTRPLGTDEAATFLYYASRPLPILVSIYGSPNSHILHSILVHSSAALFGPAEWALRLPALLAGIALVPLTYAAARMLVRDGALIAAALAASAPLLVDYSNDARGYTLLCCFALAAAMAMVEIVRSGNGAAAALFALAAAGGFYTVPVMLYPFAMIVTWGFVAARHRTLVLIAAGMGTVLTFLAYLPVLVVSGIGSVTANAYVQPLRFNLFLAALPQAGVAIWRSWMTAIPPALQLLLVAGFVAGAVRRRMTLWLGLAAVMAILFAQRTVPFTRVWLPFLIFFFITAAAAMTWRAASEILVACSVAIVLSMLTLTVPRPRETGALPHVVEIARVLASRLRAGDAVAATPPSDVPLAFYLPNANVLQPDLANSRRIFIVTNRVYGQPLGRTLAALRLDPRSGSISRVADFGDAAIYAFERK